MKTKDKETYGDFSDWIEHGLCTWIDTKKDSIYKGYLNKGIYQGYGSLTKDRNIGDVTFEGTWNEDYKEGFGVEVKKGNKGFVGFYRDGEEALGYKLRNNRRVKKLGEFDETEHKNLQQELCNEMRNVKAICDERTAIAKYTYERLAGYHDKIVNSSVKGVLGYN